MRQDASGNGAAFCVDDVYAASMLSAAHWALLMDDASGPSPAAAAPSVEAAAPPAVAQPDAAARVDFWVTWEGGAAALPAMGTSERDAFLHALRRDVADWLASAAPDAPALHLKITQVATREDGTLAVRFRLSVPAEAGAAPDAQASRRLLDVRSAVAGAASSAQAHAEAAVDSLAAKMRRNSLPAPVGPLLRALGRGRISDVAVDDARSKAAAPAPAASEPEPPADDAEALHPVASATPAPAPAPHEMVIAEAPAPAPASAHAEPPEVLRVGDDKAGAVSPVSPPVRHYHASPPAVLVVVAALSAMVLGLGALLCCAALAWRRRKLPAQAAVAQRAWLQGWHAARMQGGKQIPVLELDGATRDADSKKGDVSSRTAVEL